MYFEGSRNYVEEKVSDMIWEYETGTCIIVEIKEDNRVSVEVKKKTEHSI